MENASNTLVYKRTHKGDPDESGIFGIHDCMGRVRCWPFDAVIGVGGTRPWPKDRDIAGKINWVGIGPRKNPASSTVWNRERRPDWAENFSGPLVAFECFVFFPDGTGPELETWAPILSKHLFKDCKHFVMSRSLASEAMKEEIQEILEWASNHPSRKPASKLVGRAGDLTVTPPPRVFERKNSTKRKC